MAKPMGGQRGRQRNDREKSEYDQKVLDMARVTRVVAGGRRFSFRATVALGNRKGKIGVGIGKGIDVSQAVDKAVADAKKSMIIVALKEGTIPHEIGAKYGAAKVFLKPAPKGKGLVAGGAVRVICELAGIENISAKIISKSTNKLNNAQATIDALKTLKSAR
ncbi:MAG: 30S ribosomal protein S5 [Candidatus Portnoybacteria bacterium]|nr:30S ribosomal protein S5 [Candidatus Portnoybacteria bacterium]MDD4982568.1 30S ribosomal protein S5 [Candidatus Portnoybacteria bacterium]